MISTERHNRFKINDENKHYLESEYEHAMRLKLDIWVSTVHCYYMNSKQQDEEGSSILTHNIRLGAQSTLVIRNLLTKQKQNFGIDLNT